MTIPQPYGTLNLAPHTFRLVYFHNKTEPEAVVGANRKALHELVASRLGVAHNVVDVVAARTAWDHFQSTVATGPKDYAGFGPYLLGSAGGRQRFTGGLVKCAAGAEARVGKGTADYVQRFLDSQREVFVVEGTDLWKVGRVEDAGGSWKDGWTLAPF